MEYKNGKIYIIRSNQTEMVYVGSTRLPLHKRLQQHKKNYKKWKNGKYGYTTSYKIIKYDDAYIELYEDYACNNKKELNRREGELMRKTKNLVNKCIAGRTKEEYAKDTKHQKAEKRRQKRKWKKIFDEVIKNI
jgi:hypothetical protein